VTSPRRLASPARSSYDELDISSTFMKVKVEDVHCQSGNEINEIKYTGARAAAYITHGAERHLSTGLHLQFPTEQVINFRRQAGAYLDRRSLLFLALPAGLICFSTAAPCHSSTPSGKYHSKL
jgi:hypothetical protein